MRPLRKLLVRSILSWLPLAALTVALMFTIYAAMQNVERSSANDPQIQMATDAANALNAGAVPQNLVAATSIDIVRSYAPYLVIYDANGQLLAASATVDGRPLVPPSGVFSAARSSGMDLITWTPAPGVRNAIAVVPYANGYVLAGRSLKLTEDRESNLEFLVGVCGAATLAATFIAVFVSSALRDWPLKSHTLDA